MSSTGTRKHERLDLRLSASAKILLQRAATVRHETVSGLVVDSSLAAAAETLADRRELLLGDEQRDVLLTALDRPPSPNPRLQELLRSKGVFE